MTLAATTPVKRRFSCSIAACGVETSTNCCSFHAGQSTQPSPEPVSRTSEPVTMITYSEANASQAIMRYRRRLMPRRVGAADAVLMRTTLRTAPAGVSQRALGDSVSIVTS